MGTFFLVECSTACAEVRRGGLSSVWRWYNSKDGGGKNEGNESELKLYKKEAARKMGD